MRLGLEWGSGNEMNIDIAMYIPHHQSILAATLQSVCPNLIPAWISNYIHYKVWGEITNPFPTSTVEPLKFGKGK